jgi:lysine 2,3-aminomutase
MNRKADRLSSANLLRRPRSDWHDLLAASVSTAQELAARLPVSAVALAPVAARYPVRINPYFLGLIQSPGDPIWRQVVPDGRELETDRLPADPMDEERQSPLPGLTHRYPDRVLLRVTNRCAVFCRHCLRKRLMGDPARSPGREALAAALDYIRRHRAIREVILSGGDPLLLEDEALDRLLDRLQAIPQVEIVRIHSRVPGALPQRITPDLARLLRRRHPLHMVLQFNHPREITPEARRACRRLAQAGIPLGCQSVLLRGVNDDPAVMADLMRGLLRLGVKPYYLHHADPVRGAGHFRTDVATGLRIMAHLRQDPGGLAVPCYVADLPGGGGKVVLDPGGVERL